MSERGGGAGSAASSMGHAGGASGEAKAGAGFGAPPARARDEKPRRQLPLWLFVVLFVLFLIGYGYQTHQAGRLEDEVVRLEASLAKAEGRLESHRTHLLEIRGGVHDLSARLEDLRVLIDRDPTAEVDPKPTSADPEALVQP